MDYNQNNRNGGDQWDRWNSNASHSSYYNQPTHRPYGQAFAIAALVCGLLSVTVGFCGIALPLGALGILFSILVYRKGKRMNGTYVGGLVLSIIGTVVGVLLIVYVRFLTPLLLRQQLQDEMARQQMETMYNTLFRDGFGMDFEDYLSIIENYYGITFEE